MLKSLIANIRVPVKSIFLLSFFSKSFNASHVKTEILEAEYAVRGMIPTRADEMSLQMRDKTAKFPFKTITYCNIGNPFLFG